MSAIKQYNVDGFDVPFKIGGDFKKSPSMPNIQKLHSIGRLSNNKSSMHLRRETTRPANSRQNSINNESFVDLYMDGEEVNHRDKNNTPNNVKRDGSLKSTTTKRQSVILNPEHFDRYGFKKQSQFITEDEYDKWWRDYSQYCIRRKHKWQTFLVKSGLPLNNDSPLKFPAQSEKLKRYVRKGIPAEWRGNAWWYFARGDEMLNQNKGLYDKLLSKFDDLSKKKDKLPDLEVIERDLNRTFPDNIHFHRESFQKDEPYMIQSLRRVLIAFSIYDPGIGYCQSMNFLAGLLLLFLDEEKAFWMLVIITKKYLPGVHSINLEGVNIDQGVLMLCVKNHLPDLWGKIEASVLNSTKQKSIETAELLNKLPPITLSTASWFMSCFVGVVPIETTLRIWDCLFYEKSHFLFKVSLAILKLCEDELIDKKPSISQTIFATFSSESLDDTKNNNQRKFQDQQHKMTQDDHDMLLFQVIQTFPKKIINPNDIFNEVIFRKRLSLNKIDQDEIDKDRKYVTYQRHKWRNTTAILKKDENCNSSNENIRNDNDTLNDMNLSTSEVMDTLSSEVVGFKRVSISGTNWNNSIKQRVRNMRQRK